VLRPIPDIVGTGFGERFWTQVEFSVKRWGRRLLVLGANQDLNPWLDAFDMQVSTHKVFPDLTGEGEGRTFVVGPPDQPGFRTAPTLFGGVEQIGVTDPYLLRIGSRALGLLSCPRDTDVIDRWDRFVEAEDPSRLCAGIWIPNPRR
jgi:hypothetical protein